MTHIRKTTSRSISRPKLPKLPEKGQALNLLFVFRAKVCQDRYVFTEGHQARRCCIPLLSKNWDCWRYGVTLQKGPRTAPCGKGTVCVTLGAQATSKITTRKLINVVKSFFQSYFTKLFSHTVVMVRITFQSALVSRRRFPFFKKKERKTENERVRGQTLKQTHKDS